MATIAGVALPFFAVLLCGMLAARLRLLDDAGLMGLNAFVFWFALPALLFHKVAGTPFERLSDWTLYVGYEGSCLLLYGIVLAAVRWGAGRPLQEAAICAFAASWGNVGYMGVPLADRGLWRGGGDAQPAGRRAGHADPAEPDHPAARERGRRRPRRPARGGPRRGAQPADPGCVRRHHRRLAAGRSACARHRVSGPARARRRCRRPVRPWRDPARRGPDRGQGAGRRHHRRQAACSCRRWPGWSCW